MLRLLQKSLLSNKIQILKLLLNFETKLFFPKFIPGLPLTADGQEGQACRNRGSPNHFKSAGF
jgi:hypothetical protein